VVPMPTLPVWSMRRRSALAMVAFLVVLKVSAVPLAVAVQVSVARKPMPAVLAGKALPV